MQSESFWSVLGRVLVIAGIWTAFRWWRGDFEEKPQLNPEFKFDWRDATKDRWKGSPYLQPVPKAECEKGRQEKSEMKWSDGPPAWKPVGLDPALVRPIDRETVRKWLAERRSSP